MLCIFAFARTTATLLVYVVQGSVCCEAATAQKHHNVVLCQSFFGPLMDKIATQKKLLTTDVKAQHLELGHLVLHVCVVDRVVGEVGANIVWEVEVVLAGFVDEKLAAGDGV